MSWEQLIAIREEAKQMRKEDQEKPIVECPLCGEPLQTRGDLYNCPWGHFQQRGERRGPESF